MPPLVHTQGQSGTLRRGLRDAFANAYESVAAEIRIKLDGIADLDLPSDTSEEFYAYYESAPHPRYWPRGEAVGQAGFSAVQFSVANKDYGLEVPWHKNDEDDDQIGKMRSRAANVGTNFALLDHRIFFQLLLGTADVDLLPDPALTAPDGAVLFATTAGGAARFGATSGNLLTGTGVAAATTIKDDYFSALVQFGLFQDTAGQQLWMPGILDQGLIILAPESLRAVFSEAFYQNYTAAGALSSTSNAGVQNLIIAAGNPVDLRFSQYLTGNSWYAFLRGSTHKAIFSQLRQPVTEVPFDENTSLEHARTAHRSMIWRARKGWGLFLPYGAIKVSNS
jgi:hypothetical protein